MIVSNTSKPVITCPVDISLYNFYGTCEAFAIFSPTATDMIYMADTPIDGFYQAADSIIISNPGVLSDHLMLRAPTIIILPVFDMPPGILFETIQESCEE